MSSSFNILVIDDDSAMRDSCRQVLSRQGCRVQLAESGEQGLACLQGQPYDVVLLDLKMPGIDGLEALDRIKLIDPDVAVVIITGFATVDKAVRSMKNGAYDFIPKPFTPIMLREIVGRALKERQVRTDTPDETDSAGDGLGAGSLIGNTPTMRRLRQMIRRIGSAGSTVMVTGESGTGKELVARALHHHSPRARGPFVVIDCGCLIESLAEAELFGHAKGAFTGAAFDRPGRFEMANGGTIFLDEICNISPTVQHKLLRVLQEPEITPLGSTRVIRVDVRTIAATNAELSSQVKCGSFREDLYYRLNVIPIHLPPLRERRDDIPLLAEHFFHLFNKKRRNACLKGISDGGMRLLESYQWPGNVRELENVIERAVVLSENEVLGESDLIGHGALSPSDAPGVLAGGLLLSQAEKEHIRHVLMRYDYNILRSAQALGIDRKTLRHKARKYGLIKGPPAMAE
jgi:DNA-binding NtrC family response regulator